MKKKRRRSTFWAALGYFGAKPLVILIRILPHSVALRIGHFIGFLVYYVLPIRKKIVMQNLETAFGGEKTESELRRIARRCYQNFCSIFTEVFRIPVLTPSRIMSLINEIEGEEYFNEVGRENGRYLVVTAHLGNWEMIGTYFASTGVPLSVTARPMHDPYWNKELNKSREEKGIAIISTRESPKQIISHIRKGRIVAFLVDQDARRVGIFVDFFGKPASTFAGPAIFMEKFQLPILPVFTVRNGIAHHKVIFKRPLYPDSFVRQGEDRDKIIERIVQQYTRIIESVVRDYPEHYFWFHRRWKTQKKKRR